MSFKMGLGVFRPIRTLLQSGLHRDFGVALFTAPSLSVNLNVMAMFRPPITMYEQIGQGSFGSVFRAVDNATGEAIACKVVDLEELGDEIDEVTNLLLRHREYQFL